jgi:hypothetical protein
METTLGKIAFGIAAIIGVSISNIAHATTETFTTDIIKIGNVQQPPNQFQRFYLPFYDRSQGVLNSVTLGISRTLSISGDYDTSGPPAEPIRIIVHSDPWGVDPAYSLTQPQSALPPDERANIAGFHEPVYNYGYYIPENTSGTLNLIDTFSDSRTYTDPVDTIIFLGDPTQTYNGYLVENLSYGLDAYSFIRQNLVESVDYRFSVTYDYTSDAVPADPDPAVPEPATWGMMILGFGSIGGVMRRRRTSVSFM